MAAQSLLFAEAISGMKRAIRKADSSSDSEPSIQHSTNRGNKLKRKARYIQEGQLDTAGGPRAYRRKIEHAGYQRYILSRNPPRFDEDGDELEPDDVDEEADAAAAEDNPYSGIRLETLLAPLTSAADLPTHPSLSLPYLSKTLSEMTQQACEMVHREKASLWRMKQLLTRFRGDETWVPCGHVETENDIHFFSRKRTRSTGEPYITREDKLGNSRQLHSGQLGASVPREDRPGHTPLPDESETRTRQTPPDDSVEPGSHDPGEDSHGNQYCDSALDRIGSNPIGEGPEHDRIETEEPIRNPPERSMKVEMAGLDGSTRQKPTPDMSNSTVQDSTEMDMSIVSVASVEEGPARDGEGTGEDTCKTAGSKHEDQVDAERREGCDAMESVQPAQHRMTTRAQAQIASDKTPTSPRRSPSPLSPAAPFVHPFFVVPLAARPDSDLGLPLAEAEDTRRVLMLYVQKQEEVCRGVEKLYDGLLKADRLRQTVLKWCKAEEHVGEMSDGEDWYDKEEWGLEEELKKGHEEEEDEGANQGKKTRGRRA